MISQPPVALDYEIATVFYPRLRDAPRWFLVLIALLPLPIALGCWMVTWGGTPMMWRAGALYLGTSALAFVGLSLLYIRAATWLCVSGTGITLSIAFWRRSVPWNRVREVRLVLWDGAITAEPVIEVAFNDARSGWRFWRRDHPPGYWFINARLFGWSPDALVGEMKRWHSGHTGV